MYKQTIYAFLLLMFLTIYLSGLETGEASWYGGKFQGRLTANGERFDTNLLTAAHKTLPFNTIVEVKNLGNDKIVHVRINDRGPFVEGRIIDLSRAAASRLDMVGKGVANVEIRIIENPAELAGNKDHNAETGLLQHKWIIQIASFANKENADKVMKKLNNYDFNPYLELTPSGNMRIILRNITDIQVESIKDKLRTLGFSTILLRKQLKLL